MTNRFKGLDVIERVPEALWMEVHNIVQEAMIKKKKCRKEKWLSEEALQTAMKRSERQSRIKKIYSFECRHPKNSRER